MRYLHHSYKKLTRCICRDYDIRALPAVGGVLTSRRGGQRVISALEHALSCHWEGICSEV